MATVASPGTQSQYSSANIAATYNAAAYGTSDGSAVGYQSLAQLTGGNYATAASNEPTSNWPFDTRIQRANFNKSSAPVTSGVMSTLAGTTAQVFSCYFLFNPTEIDLDYSFDSGVTGSINPIYASDAANTETQGLLLTQTQSFTLLFDRTYEVWTGSQAPDFGSYLNGGPYYFGAQWDVWAIERLVGVYGQAAGNGPSGPPAANIIQVAFGGVTGSAPAPSGRTGGPGANNEIGATTPPDSASNGLSPWVNFAGWMTDFEVEYTRFDANMVPTRAAVSLSFMQVYSLPAVYTTAAPPDPGTDGDSDNNANSAAPATTTPAGGSTQGGPSANNEPSGSATVPTDPGGPGAGNE